ncbi:hypothetical protein TWF694_007866 [Orbilia ellipsospora]|uniref:Chitin-binding type-1 domain-containing protein n=1 Tax=Orbilia ellipsospora TaxID=2528407 RepID=A0AAV9XKH7_9PEZI
MMAFMMFLSFRLLSSLLLLASLNINSAAATAHPPSRSNKLDDLELESDLEYLASPDHYLYRRDAAPVGRQACSFWLHTDNTTDSSCSGILKNWNLTFTEFKALNSYRALFINPNNASDCTGVAQWDIYCVAGPLPPLTTTNGRCGPQFNDTTCPGSTYGPCCSVSGWCGSGYGFCGIGNCIGGSCTNGTGWSTDGKCGANATQPRCGGQFGVCCSSSGWCGNDTSHCGASCIAGACQLSSSTTQSTTLTPTQSAGCQAGQCWTSLPPTGPVTDGSIASTTANTSSSTKSTSTSSSTSTSTPKSSDGTCGGTKGYTCSGSTFGNCCSSKGYCGSTGVYCGEGCQKSWSSSCQTTNISSNNGRCGVISGSPAFTCTGGTFDGQCCSAGGYCGSSSSYCGTGCQTAYGKCS